jgi:hypothetical protein
MTAANGMGSFNSVAEQSAYGTPETASKHVRVSSTNLKRTRNRKPRNHLGLNGVAAYSARDFIDESDEAGGQFEIPLYYDDGGIGMILAALFGAVADAGGGAPYTHDFTLTTPMGAGFLNGLTLWQGNGEEDAERFTGAILSAGELKVDAGGQAALVVSNVIAQTSGGLIAQGTPSFAATAEAIDFDHFGAISWNGRAAVLRSFSLKWTRMYERRPHLGTLYTLRPVQAGFIKIEFTAQVDHGESTDTTNLDTDWHAGTSADLTISAAGTGDHALGITVHNAYIEDISRPIGGTGLVRSTIKWIGLGDAVDQGLKIRLTNALATYKT